MQNIIIKAPLSGVIIPIEQVPDPVFAQKMVGDGISIDPVNSSLTAPFAGEVSQLHNALHAITLTHASGLEVMMHIGLDTVSLKSKGFTARVEQGQQVAAGDILIEFDSDYIATHARSLLTQVILTNGEMVAAVAKAEGSATAGETDLLTVTLGQQTGEDQESDAREIISEAVIIPNSSGLHARPAAVLAGMAKKFKARLQLLKGEESANARSVVSIMKLNVQHLDKVQLLAAGEDAEQAIAEILPLLQSGLGDEGTTAIVSPAAIETSSDQEPPPPASGDPDLLLGVTASPGIAVGTTVRIREELFQFTEDADDPHTENVRLDRAVEEAKNHLEALQANLHQQEDKNSQAAIFAAHREILDDLDLTRSMTA